MHSTNSLASIKSILRPIRNRFSNKYRSELGFWHGRLRKDHGYFQNSHYEKLMLAMADEPNTDFLSGKIVADFGCGPRGSLEWAKPALMRIGIDVLADRYVDEFTQSVLSHDMVYLKSTESVIPLPSGFVDVMYTLNAIDHVNNFATMCSEMLRVLKPGGIFIGSINLEEPATACEPQQLTEAIVRQSLLDNLEVQSYRITNKLSGPNTFAPFFEGNLSYQPGQKGLLWVRAHKPTSN